MIANNEGAIESVAPAWNALVQSGASGIIQLKKGSNVVDIRLSCIISIPPKSNARLDRAKGGDVWHP